ncbi:MAG: ATP-dependent Clp protease ATP-binding subunit [Verrucomicrobia bacterium]|nr:ATP-dependent Clp protease ATP-binding subunit [Verrucomicrobiota bacterium]
MDRLISPTRLEKLRELGEFLSSHLIGQAEVISEVTDLLQQSFCGMWFENQPLASVLLLGPTGTGKTALAELCTEHLFGNGKLIRLDMSEYMNGSALERLIGNRIGDRGLFGHYFDRCAGEGTILFDEIEKAEPRIVDILLQILSAGRFSLANGETLNLTRFMVFVTSNIGAQVLMGSRSTDRETIVMRTETSLQADMRPEIVARFDLIASFNKLSYQDLMRIAELHMEKALAKINVRGHQVTVGDGVLGFIQRQGYSEKFGARPVRKAAMRVLGGTVKKAMLANGGGPVCGVLQYDRRANRCFIQ